MKAIRIGSLSSKEIKDIYQSVAPYAISKTCYLIKDVELAKDIVHDAFVKIMSLDKEFVSLKALYGWLYKACHNAGIDFLRSSHAKAMNEEFDESKLLTSDASPETRTVNARYVSQFLGHLRKKEAEIFCYRYVDEMNLAEIAELLEVSEKTVARILEKAHKNLNEKIAVWGTPVEA